MFEPRDIENPIAEEDMRIQARKDICIDESAAISEETFNKVEGDAWDLLAKLFDGIEREVK